jgi:hypothetical protein
MSRSTAGLLGDYAAGYAVAGVAGRIGLHVVGFGVDYDRGAAIAEERVRAVPESYVFILKSGAGFAFHVDGEVLHVAGVVAFGIIEAVLLSVRIKMRAGRFEIGSIALGVLMKVDGVLARRKIVKLKLEADARAFLPEGDRAYGFALSVLDFDFSFGGAGKRGDGEQGCDGDEGKRLMFHVGIIANFRDGGVVRAPMGHA